MPGLTPIHGSCHCGNVRFELLWPADEAVIQSRCCSCSFCQKHGGAWTSHRDAELTLDIEDPGEVSDYRFGTGTADFQVCSICGVVPIVLSEIDGHVYAVVNVNTFSENKGFTFSSASTDFDGENTSSRLERRKKNWISSVSIP